MRRIGLAVLFGVFMGLIANVSAGRLYEWYQTGQLTVHRKLPVGPDVVTYSSDPVGFLIQFNLNLFLLIMAGYGVLIACRDVFLEVNVPFFDLRPAGKLIAIFNLLTVGFLLAFGLLHWLVWR